MESPKLRNYGKRINELYFSGNKQECLFEVKKVVESVVRLSKG